MTARILLLLTLLSTVASAHPGHGHTDPGGWLHYLTEPLHVALLVVVAVAGVGWWAARRRRTRTSE